MEEWQIALFFVVALLFLFSVIGMPIAFGLSLASFIGLALFLGWDIAMVSLQVVLFGSVSDIALIPIPLFILMASLFIGSGLARKGYDIFTRLFGGFKPGLPIATMSMMGFFGALMGASSATISMITQMGAPELKQRGYNPRLIGGLIAAGGGLAVVIPPSMLMILYSIVMQVPVIPLFAAGLIPGLMMALGYCLWLLYDVSRHPPVVATRADVPVAKTAVARAVGNRSVEVATASRERGFGEEAIAALEGRLAPMQRAKALLELMPFFLVALITLGSMFLGFAVVTEAAAVGCLGAILVALLYRSLTLTGFVWALWNTARISCFILLLVIGGRYFGLFLSRTGIANNIGEWIRELPFSGYSLMFVVIFVFLCLGSIMETISMMLVLVPIAGTALVAQGFDPILIGVVLVIILECSLITPPIGGNLFILAGMARPYGITFEHAARGAVPFLIINLIVIALLVYFPVLTNFLASRV